MWVRADLPKRRLRDRYTSATYADLRARMKHHDLDEASDEATTEAFNSSDEESKLIMGTDL